MISIRCLAYWPLLLLLILSGCGGQTTSQTAPLADSLILPASSRSLVQVRQGIATVYTRYADRVFVVVNERGDVQNAESLPRCGLMDTAGRWMLPDTCQSIEHVGNDRQSHHLFLATRTTRTGTGVITEKGAVVVPFQYADLHYLGNGLLSNNEATGDQVVKVINLKNEVLIHTKDFDVPASMASFGLIPVITTQQRKTGFVDQHGKWVIPPLFDLIGAFEKVN